MPVELLTTPMPPVVISAGFVLLEMPMRPMSGMYDDRENLRSTWSSDFCSLYEPDMNAFQLVLRQVAPAGGDGALPLIAAAAACWCP